MTHNHSGSTHAYASQSRGYHGGSGSSSRAGLGAAGLVTAAAAAAMAAGTAAPAAHAEATSDADNSSAVPDATKRAKFVAWLASNGCDMSAIAIQPSPVSFKQHEVERVGSKAVELQTAVTRWSAIVVLSRHMIGCCWCSCS